VIKKKDEMGGVCGMYGKKGGAHRVLVGKKSPLARPRCGWKDNVHLEVTAWESVDWISLAQDRITEHYLTLGFHIMWEFLELLRKCQVLKKDSAAWNRKFSIRISAGCYRVA
jgi:hypothetical protein